MNEARENRQNGRQGFGKVNKKVRLEVVSAANEKIKADSASKQRESKEERRKRHKMARIEIAA